MRNLSSVFVRTLVIVAATGATLGPAQASITKTQQGRFDPKVLVGHYVATDCEDTIRQSEPKDNPFYVNTELVLSLKNGSIQVAYQGVANPDYLRVVPDAFRREPQDVELSEARSAAYGVYKVLRTARFRGTPGKPGHPGFRDEWEIKSEGYNVTGIALTARHFVDSEKGEPAEKMISCHYAKVGTR